jgi:hypothetical protein
LKQIAVVVANIPGADVTGSYWTMTITAFALFVSGLRQLAAGTLTLYTGLIIFLLLYMHAYASVLCVLHLLPEPRLKRGGSKPTIAEAIRHLWTAQLYISPVLFIATALGYTIFANPGHFGPQQDCDQQAVLGFLGVRMRATGTGRSLSLAFISMNTYILIAFSLSAPSLALYMRFRARAVAATRVGDILSTAGSECYFIEKRPTPWRRHRGVSPVVLHVIRAFLNMLVLALFVCTTESTLVANSGLGIAPAADAEWTLGQVRSW